MPLRDILLALTIVAIWGFNFVVIKMSVEALPPILAAAFRFTLAAVPAIFFVPRPRTGWLKVAGFGVMFAFALYSFLNLSLKAGMPAGLTSVVLQVQAFFTIIIAFFVFGDRPRPMQIVGAGVAFAGIAVIGSERFAGTTLWPFLLTLAAALSWGIANVISKSVGGKVSPISLTVWGSLIGAIPLYIFSFLVEGPQALTHAVAHPSWNTFFIIAFLAWPASLFGVAVWNTLLKKHPASMVAPFTLLVPITGLLSGWAVLGETITPVEIAGGALVVAGLGVTVLRKPGKKVPVNRTLPEV